MYRGGSTGITIMNNFFSFLIIRIFGKNYPMAITISIQDTLGLKVSNEIDVKFERDVVTVKDIIQARVEQEVANYNKRQPEYFKGLVQPTDAEKTLNGYKLKKHKPIDAEKQVYVALDAFNKNAYFVLIDNKQVESLEQVVTISAKSSIKFVKLTPLVGG